MTAPMVEAPQEALLRAAYDILEEGLFLMIEPSDAPLGPDAVVARMAVTGAWEGELGFGVDAEVGHALAVNLLATGDVAEADVAASVAETLNMLAGKLMAYLIGTDAVVDLIPPVMGGEARGEQRAFATDGGRIVMWLCEGASCP